MTVSAPPARVLKLDRPHARAAGALTADTGTDAPAGWNLSDFESGCDERLEAARDRCRTLLAEAVAEADALREQAREEGLAAGRAEGAAELERRIAERAAAEAEQRSSQRLAAALAPLGALVDAYRTEQERWRAGWERDAVGLACAIAGRLLDRELDANPAAAADLAAEALAAAEACRAPAVAMHPDDLAALGEKFATRVTATLGPGATLSADPALSRGDCVVRTPEGAIDGRLGVRLDRIAAELLPADEASA